MGRKPSQVTQIDHILDELETGRSLNDIILHDPVMPKYSTFFDWVAKDPELADKYAHAREIGSEKKIEEIEEIADEDYLPDMGGKIDNAQVQARRLRIDTKKWILSKQFPKKYGDRVDLNHSGSIQTSAAEIIKNIHESRANDDNADSIQSGES